MPENINWDAVLQSITDTWLPLILVAGMAIVGIIVFAIIRKRKKK